MSEEYDPKSFKGDEEPLVVKTEIIQRLESLPDLIKIKEIEVMNFSNNASLNETDMKEREAFVMTEIAIKKESDDKTKFYKNEDARQGELKKRLIGDKAYKEIHKNWEHNKLKKQKSEIQLHHLFNSFSATKHLVRLFTYNLEEKQ